jgi:transposase
MVGFLSSEQIRDFEKRHRSEKKKQPSDKIKAMLLLNRGFSHSEVANILLIDITTVWRWYQIFTEKGLNGASSGSLHWRDQKAYRRPTCRS